MLAAKLFRKAAEQNLVNAQTQLGYCYTYGEGVVWDAVEAAKWFRKAAEQKDNTARFALAGCYAGGRGVAMDYVEAYAWYNLYSDRSWWATNYMGPLAAKMTPQQLADAEKRSKELQKEIEAKTKSNGH